MRSEPGLSLIHRLLDCCEPVRDQVAHVGMRENVQLIVAARREYLRRDGSRLQTRFDAPGELGEQISRRTSRLQRRAFAITTLPIASACSDPGPHKVRAHNRNPDAVWPELHRQSFRHADYGELARHIRTKAQPGVHAGHGRGIYDVPALSVSPKVRQKTADPVQHAHQIDVEDPAPVIKGDRVYTAGGRNAGIVADHMNLAEGFNGCLSRAVDAFRSGNVAGDSANLRSEIAQAFGGFAQGIRLDVRKHHIHALLCEGSPERETDATRTPGHECRLACEYVHDDLPGDAHRSPGHHTDGGSRAE